MNRLSLTALFLLLAPPALATDDDFVYESHAGVMIGRVFLSQSQREQLDARRLAGPPGPSIGASSSVDGVAAKPAPTPAGYIKSSLGRSRVWKDGDFVESGDKSAARLPFPGDVKVVRHESVDEPVGDGD